MPIFAGNATISGFSGSRADAFTDASPVPVATPFASDREPDEGADAADPGADGDEGEDAPPEGNADSDACAAADPDAIGRGAAAGVTSFLAGTVVHAAITHADVTQAEIEREAATRAEKAKGKRIDRETLRASLLFRSRSTRAFCRRADADRLR